MEQLFLSLQLLVHFIIKVFGSWFDYRSYDVLGILKEQFIWQTSSPKWTISPVRIQTMRYSKPAISSQTSQSFPFFAWHCKERTCTKNCYRPAFYLVITWFKANFLSARIVPTFDICGCLFYLGSTPHPNQQYCKIIKFISHLIIKTVTLKANYCSERWPKIWILNCKVFISFGKHPVHLISLGFQFYSCMI